MEPAALKSRRFPGLFVSFAMVVLLPGCGRKATVPVSPQPVLERIASVDVDIDHYPSYVEYHHRVYGQMETAVRQLSSPVELKALFLECHRRWMAAPDRPQERLLWVDPYAEACEAIVCRLGDLASEQAASVLVELFADETLTWDGDFAENAAHNISRFGKKVIPYLEKVNFGDRRAEVQEIVRCIEKGELYGP
jgi:hypothetical protein